ncbi:GGDEF domain-containing protein [Tepidicella xavieri]|jgi:diguanylate cyclase|uniref:diguanylate cyclase n=1 Tax=Tepidicella xavieri TaxID=360241 RepID=A0A4R6UHC4_9BURK|nr:GGDEF domain-containing protein [Tepidicella xavieri]TDQ44375.1 diguanylate cyclase [Tepidicella xavieri]
MEYPESREKSAELLRQVIALMGQHDAPFNPITYTVWYEYAAGLNARLREAIDRFVLTEPRLSQATTERLYREHVASVDDKTMDRISRDFQQVMSHMAHHAARAGEQAGAFDAELTQLHGALSAQDAEALRARLPRTLQRSQAMRDATTELRTQVAASRAEIERLRADLDRAREEVFIDSLTKVLNRKGLDHRLEQILTQARAGQDAGHGLVMLDIDHFKLINDQHGHLVGDQVLAAVGEVLRQVVTDPTHVVARYGGEEFAIVLPHAGLEAAAALAEKVCRTTRAMKLRKRNAHDVVLSVTVSAGAAVHRPGESAQDWVARADAALYRSKQAGRDRVTVAELS